MQSLFQIINMDATNLCAKESTEMVEKNKTPRRQSLYRVSVSAWMGTCLAKLCPGHLKSIPVYGHFLEFEIVPFFRCSGGEVSRKAFIQWLLFLGLV